MSQAITVDDLRKQITRMKDRIFRLEKDLPSPEAVRYIGATGQPAFANGWVNIDTDRPAGFYRDRSRVYLTGIIKSGTVAATAFTLPAGYLPAVGAGNTIVVPTISNGVFGALQVFSDGRVMPATGSNAWFALEGISFRYA